MKVVRELAVVVNSLARTLVSSSGIADLSADDRLENVNRLPRPFEVFAPCMSGALGKQVGRSPSLGQAPILWMVFEGPGKAIESES
ncbi:hypothetical protein C0Q70_19324 [Pomacea canaliculata]|uniref:Uncharacterized protein n=1 Tax=Pomacea canaliculata TaxID=400727 RepID=A0A2T7NJ04_POMCA|nr:hypothetical protein C0Q70_19324 [Pomacea canaliculata]